MTSVPITLADGRSVTFDVDFGREGPAYFVLSVRKCGSTVFNNICNVLSIENNCRFVDVAGVFFPANIPETAYLNDPAFLSVLQPRNTYGGFRMMPTIFLNSPIFHESPKLLLIRDPRDALVSEYFSMAYSHPLPEPVPGRSEVSDLLNRIRAQALQTGLDEFVRRRARSMAAAMLGYAPVLKIAHTTVLKYEDYIFDKRALIVLIAEKFGWRVGEEFMQKTLKWADVRPQQENPKAFIRKVTPGDHREKLSPDTIATIDRDLRPALDLFGYV